jgi:hypothetical protein
MAEYGGFLFLIDEERRASRVKRFIEHSETFTDTISVPDWHTKRAEIFLISLGGHAIGYAALAHRGRVVATEKRQVRFTNFVEFSPAIQIRQIQELLDPKFHSYFVRASSGMGSRVTPKTWQQLIKVIKTLRPSSREGLERLEKLREMRPEFFSRPGIEVLAEERDAVNLALRMSDFDKKDVLTWSPPEDDETELPPFVQGLPSVKLIEDQMIAHDAEVFGNWKKLARSHVGTVEFRKGQERLSIMNVNRHSVERTLGVDLFYFHYRYRSYVMVQYKRMEKETSGMVYRLGDKTYEAELQRMRYYEGILKKANLPLMFDLKDYRLHPGTAYFKLCPVEALDLASTDMIKGMYIPLDYWDALLKSPNIFGQRGGRQITFENVERYFNNTLFIHLAQAGWIGSNLEGTDILTKLIRLALEGDRSLILAALQSYSEP